MTEYRIPNLFIIGAPKCGTTAMSHYLAGHPHIFMSELVGIKEPRFFSTDLNWWGKRIETLSDYLKLFESAPEEARYLGEASPHYLYSDVAVTKILEFSPDAKLIVMIRNPIDVARSFYNECRKIFLETADNFEQAWRLQEQRRSGLNLPTRQSNYEIFQYGDIASLGSQLRRLFEVVPRSQVKVIVYDDLEEDTSRVYSQVLAFLGLESDLREEFPIINRSIEYRWPALERWLMHLRVWRERLGIRGGIGLHKLITVANVYPERAGGLSAIRPQFRHILQLYFQDEVNLMSELLDRDFQYWLR